MTAPMCRLNNRRGASAIEFALMAPILFVILFGIIEFGILFFDKAMITNASREGARTGIVFRNPALTETELEALVTGVVTNYCADHLISFGPGSTLAVDVDRSGTEAGDNLTVTVTYPFRFLVFSNVLALIGGNKGNLTNLSAQTVMRLE